MPLPDELINGTIPTQAELDVFGLRKEALREIASGTKDAHLSAAYDFWWAQLGTLVTRPIVALPDSSIRQAICQIASLEMLGFQRGVSTQGPDGEWARSAWARIDSIIQTHKDIDKRRAIGLWTDSTPAVDEAGPGGGADATADAWTRRNGLCGYGCGVRT